MAASAAEIRAYAREALRGKWGYGIIVWILALLINTLISLPEYLVDDGNTFGDVWSIISSALSWCMWFGVMACFLDIARKTHLSYKRLFTGFRSFEFFFKFLITEFFQTLFLVCWYLLLIVPGIIKYYSYAMTEFILLDHPEYGPLQAITESKKMMYGHRMRLFILGLSFIGWFFLCIITLGIASLWVVPYYGTARAKFYIDLKAEYEKKLAATPIQEAETVPAEPVEEEEKGFEVEE
jgi:uncharacterized membrane protein